MNVLVFGANGMLGHKLIQVIGKRHTTIGTIRSSSNNDRIRTFFSPEQVLIDLDMLDGDSLNRLLEEANPDIVINAVGVVKQKQNSATLIDTLSVNSIFPNRLALLSDSFGFRVITISTDCVFSGNKGTYSEHDEPDALDLYGQSKHWGELSQDSCLTIRTSIIGRETSSGHGLVEWFISNKGRSVDGYTRAVFSGFPTVVLAGIIVDIIENHQELSGVFHISSEPVSKFDFLTKVNDVLGLGITINRSDKLVIDRSLDSTRFQRLAGFEPQDWDTMIASFAADSAKYE